jgi:hypothetical protein
MGVEPVLMIVKERGLLYVYYSMILLLAPYIMYHSYQRYTVQYIEITHDTLLLSVAQRLF